MNTKIVCNNLNITIKALRVYEQEGIVIPKRRENGYRDYSDKDVMKLQQVILLREMGFSLKEIKILLDKNKEKQNDIIHSFYFQMKVIENKINELQNIKLTLKENINQLLNAEESKEEVCFNNIREALEHNKAERKAWVDRWRFDDWAPKYDNIVKENPKDELGVFKKYDEVIEKVRKYIIKSLPKKVLDIGCGTGSLCGELDKSIYVTGIDQSIDMLLETKKRYPNMIYKLGNFLDKPVGKEEFDVVVTTYAFHHLNSREKNMALDYMIKYLKPNGKIIIGDLMFLNEEEKERKREEFYNRGRSDLWQIVEDEYYSNIEELKVYIEKKGYKLEYEHISNFTWIVTIYK
ncbi:MerR family transcriptional regulator [Clostridium ganghwense]|uniref:MerR family transcriptional regulator n=1 Tax=Clostridium ganghwense TaxID=312089 RepID=A0ABT4CM11_9CLOT|nr:MerR family transcriptional regulator [Clostridium ganghwense]MCY6370084.1 MerR family transcriptional regulator [Clostridium ganghwense]